jgi:hypothetical protein
MEAISENKVKVKLISDTAADVRKLGSIETSEKAAIKVEEISTVELVKSFMQILTNSSADKNKNNFKYMSQIWALTMRSLSIVDAE